MRYASAPSWVIATSTSKNRGKRLACVVVWSDEVSSPKAVRYAWGNFPDNNLYNKEGLPASPFPITVWPLA